MHTFITLYLSVQPADGFRPQLLEGFTGASCASPDSTSPALLLSPHCLQSGLVATSNKHASLCASRKVNAGTDVP